MLLFKAAVSQFPVHRMIELLVHVFFTRIISGFDHVRIAMADADTSFLRMFRSRCSCI